MNWVEVLGFNIVDESVVLSDSAEGDICRVVLDTNEDEKRDDQNEVNWDDDSESMVVLNDVVQTCLDIGNIIEQIEEKLKASEFNEIILMARNIRWVS